MTHNHLSNGISRELTAWHMAQPHIIQQSTSESGSVISWKAKWNNPTIDDNKPALIACGGTWATSDSLAQEPISLSRAETFQALVILAFENRYRPWLEFAAKLPYSGSETAGRLLALLG